MPPVRIGVNALYLIPGGVGGTEIYLRSLLAELARIDRVNRYFVYTNRETGPDLVPAAPNFHPVPQPVRAAFRPARILWEQTGVVAAARRDRLDVLFNPGFTSPAFAPVPGVTVFHDLQHKRHPEHFRWFELPFWNLLTWVSARRSRLILADSEATAADFARYYPRAAAKVRHIPLGVDEDFFAIAEARREVQSEPFLLAVSTLHPHKNLEGLVEAFARFREGQPGYRLVIAGMRGFHTQAIERRIAGLGLAAEVELTGWIPRADLLELFRRASAFLYPSTFEGFGLPVVEALAAGVPLACSDIPPLRSIAGGAALLFDPSSTEAIAEAMRRLVEDGPLRERLTREGPPRAREFSWRRTAERTLEAMIEAAGSADSQSQ